MSGLNDLEPGADIMSDGGRGLLQQTLDKFSNAFRNVRAELTKVREQDAIVAPVPIQEFPTCLGVTTSQVGGAPQNSILFSKTDATPAGYSTCDGTNGTPDLQGRVPMGAGTGAGLTARAVGDVIGAESVAADLASHNHDMANHTHSTPSHAHNMAHTHDMGNHVHDGQPRAIGGGGSTTVVHTTTALDGGASVYNTSGPSTNTTSQPSTSVTATDGSGTSGAPSTNTTGNAGGGGGHANIQPSRVLKALMKTTSGDIDLPRKCPILFGRIPALLDLESPAVITNISAVDAYEVIETGQPPEAISEVSMTSGNAGGNSTVTVLRFKAYLPYNFRKWKTQAVRIRTKLSMTGCGGGSTATVTLKARKPTSTSAFLVGTNARTLAVDGSGNLADSAWVDMTLKTTDLQDDWQPGYFLACEVVWSIPKTFATASLKVGRLQINW